MSPTLITNCIIRFEKKSKKKIMKLTISHTFSNDKTNNNAKL